MINSAAIDTRQLRVRRGGRVVVDDVTFAVPTGSVTGLLGPSGCGKTTVMRCVVGAQITAGGTVTVLDLPAGDRRLRGRIGYATQSPAVYADLTVEENLTYFASVTRAPREDVGRVLEEVGLTGQARQLTAQLSGGQRSRASLAVALLGRPEVLVLDEPTVGLDPVLRDELWMLFHHIAAEGTTLLISSHVMDEAARCERLLLMRDARLLADDSPGGLRRLTGQQDLEQAFLHLVRTTHPTEVSS